MASPAPSCVKALQDATARWPNRNRASDGIMGDPAHQARKSDHNDGNAFDLTHDPSHGVDCNSLSRQMINDARVTYVIWNKKIYNRSRAAESWRDYTGSNPHNRHMHVSISAAKRNDLASWPWTLPPGSKPAYPGTPLRKGSKHSSVITMQQRLAELKYDVKPDGDFGPKTEKNVITFQQNNSLIADGVVGPATWNKMWSPTVVKARPPVVAPPYPGKALREGDKGPNVTKVQTRMKELRHKITPDGVFGPKTKQEVIIFQKNRKLTGDGIVGRKTWAALWV